MRIAPPAAHFRTAHAPRSVMLLDNILRRHRLVKARPPRPRIELGFRIEQRRPAADAAKQTVAVKIPELPGECEFSVRPPRHHVLIDGQLLLPLGIGLPNARNLGYAHRPARV